MIDNFRALRSNTVLRSKTMLTASSCIAMLFLGLASTLIGAAARNINLSASQIGLIIAVQNIGFGFSVWLSGALSDTRPKPRILMVGSLVLAVSFLTFYLSPVFWINLVIMFMVGIGIGSYEGVTDAMLFDLHEEKASFYINVNHFFVTCGGLLITFYLIFLEMNWRSAVVQSGIVVLGLALFFALSVLPPSKRWQASYRERMRILANSRIVALLFFATVLAVGVELGTISILTTFLVQLRGFSQLTSKLCLIVFFVGMASGRLLIGAFAESRQLLRYVLALFGLGCVFFTLLYFVDLGSFTYVSAFLAGIAISAILPLILAYSGAAFKEMTGTVMGTIKVGIPIGGIVIPFVMSVVAGVFSLQTSLLVFPVAFLIGFVLLLQAGRIQT